MHLMFLMVLNTYLKVSNGLISEGGTRFLGKLMNVSLSATKAVANRKVSLLN